MHKHELVGITLQHLMEHFRTSPESFEYLDHNSKPMYANDCIIWQPKVQLGDIMSTTVDDPNNGHAVVVMFNDLTNELTCYIFLKAPPNLTSMSNPAYPADCVVTSRRRFEKWRNNYKMFSALKDLILIRNKRKESMTYLKKLSSVFPDTMDTHLLDE